MAPIPGIIPIRFFMLPSFFMLSTCSKKSLKLNCPFLIFLVISLAFSISITPDTFSAKDSISPAPISLETILSGINTSRSAGFSPIPINLNGTPIWLAIPRATPPFESPSNFDKITPFMPILALKLSALLTPS